MRKSEQTVVGGPLLEVRVGLSSSLWRIGPGWAALAGAFASGQVNWTGGALLRLLAIVFLTDAVWGSLWQGWCWRRTRAPGRSGMLAVDHVGWLPYFKLGSPAGHFVAWFRRLALMDGAYSLTGVLIMLALAFSVSAWLGQAVLWLTLVQMAVVVAGWLWAGAMGRPAVWFKVGCALVFPWLAGLLTFGHLKPAALVLMGVYSLLVWGMLALDSGEGEAAGWFGRFLLLVVPWSVVVLLGLTGKPLAALLVGLLNLLPGMLLAWSGKARAEWRWLFQRSGPWWLGGMLVASIALGSA